MLKNLFPYEYVESVFTIDYKKLYELGFRGIIFDLDNTLALIDDKNCPDKVKKLVKKLKKDFKVLIISNNTNSKYWI